VFDRSRRCIAFEGRIVVVGFAGGRIADAPTNHALVKNYSIVGLHWGLYRQQDPQVIPRTHAALVALWEQGLVDPLVGAELPLTDAPQALARLGDRGTVGKVVLLP
jgi:NADPH2:quinone reductase